MLNVVGVYKWFIHRRFREDFAKSSWDVNSYGRLVRVGRFDKIGPLPSAGTLSSFLNQSCENLLHLHASRSCELVRDLRNHHAHHVHLVLNGCDVGPGGSIPSRRVPFDFIAHTCKLSKGNRPWNAQNTYNGLVRSATCLSASMLVLGAGCVPDCFWSFEPDAFSVDRDWKPNWAAMFSRRLPPTVCSSVDFPQPGLLVSQPSCLNPFLERRKRDFGPARTLATQAHPDQALTSRQVSDLRQCSGASRN